MEPLPSSLGGHLTDYDRPLEVYLLKGKSKGSRLYSHSVKHTHARTHAHIYTYNMYLNPAGVLFCAPCIVFTLIVQSGKMGFPVSFKEGNKVIPLVS